MEPDKFETYIKSKLDAREITPASKAWHRISKELKSEPVAKKPGYFWLSIAASVAVIIGVAIFYMANEEKVMPVSPVIVQKPVTVPMNNEEESMLLDTDKDINTLALEDDTTKAADSEKQEIAVFTKDTKSDDGNQGQKDAVVAQINEQESKAVEIPSQLSEAVLNDKIAEVVAQVVLMEQSSQVTDAEVDSLLRNAQETIFKEQLFKPDKSVDAMALLTQVEDELDQSFRDQIFQSLKTGFLRVRTAVADRNN
jgi:hypothetical protein